MSSPTNELQRLAHVYDSDEDIQDMATSPEAASQSDHQSASSTGEQDEQPEKKGFDRGLEPEAIVGVTEARGKKLMYLMKWLDCDDPEFVPASEAGEKCPELVIEFYEGRQIKWSADENNHEWRPNL